MTENNGPVQLSPQYYALAHLAAFGMIITDAGGAFLLGALSRIFFDGETLMLRLIDGETIALSETDKEHFLTQTKAIAMNRHQQQSPPIIAVPKVQIH